MEDEVKKFGQLLCRHKVNRSPTMKILVAESFGICFGVRDAITQAEQLAAEQPLTILGELVHNPIVRERLRGKASSKPRSRARVPAPRVMITAHGASDRKRAEWRAAGFEVADGTCPLVRHAHEQLKRLVAAGYFPVVIGQRGHVEVNGLIEDFPEGVVVSVRGRCKCLPKRPRYGIISQTTQPIDFVREIVDLIRRAHPEAEVRFTDTVCKPTKDRQAALAKIDRDRRCDRGGGRTNEQQYATAGRDLPRRRQDRISHRAAG